MIKRNRVIAIGMAVLVAVTATGCGVNTDTPILGKLMGLNSGQVMKIGTAICTSQETKLVLMNMQNQYKKDFGDSVSWDQKIGDTTLQDFIKDKVKNELSVIYAMVSMAKDNKITLTEDEKKRLSEAAKTYYDSLTDAEIEYTETTVKDVELLYENYYLADKVYTQGTAGVSDEISDEEARVISVQYIYIDTSKTDKTEAVETLEQVKKQVENGYQDFLVQAKKYGNNTNTECNFKKNEAKKEVQKKAFELENNKISEVITEDDGVYLVKCMNSYLKDETQKNKEQIIRNNKISSFNEKYEAYIKKELKDFNTKVWDSLELSSNSEVNASNLFEIYDNVFK